MRISDWSSDVCSSDLSFLDLSQLDIKDFTQWGLDLRQKILKEVGIPVSIGIAPSKTLAKLATSIAKKDLSLSGVLAFNETTTQQKTDYLTKTDIQDIWGVGRRLSPDRKSTRLNSSH